MTFDSSFRVNTPENVSLEYPLAGIGSRFLAALVDYILIACLLLVVNLVAGFVLFLAIQRYVEYLDRTPDWAYWAIGWLGLIAFLFQYGYFIFFEVIWSGQTPGKRIVRLRVVRSNGLPIAAGEAMIRNVVRIVDSIPVGYGVGLVAMFADGQSRRLGDIAAGTLVIREQASVTLDSLMDAAREAKDAPERGREGTERLTSSDRLLLEDFLRRRKTLANREKLAGVLLEAVCRRLGRMPRESERADPEVALEMLARRPADGGAD
jgi:uncharacterized RDD family membrane protein YckC